MEKIKDFFHDFSDIFIAIIIAGIMFAVLTINLGGWFNEPIHTVLADKSVDSSGDQNNNIIDNRSDNNIDLKDGQSNTNIDSENNQPDTNIDSEDNQPDINIDPENARPDNSIDSKGDKSETKDDTSRIETGKQQNDIVENSETNKDVQTNKTVKETKKITIPSGASGTGIARILKENELIDDINDFVQTAENLNLSRRLRSGFFEIPINTTIENMVKIIAGQENI